MKINSNIFTILLISLIMIFMSCEDEIDGIPKAPDSFQIDVNDDGKVDYTLEYKDQPIFTSTITQGITAYLNPHNDNLVLHKEDSPNLFLRNLGEVEENVLYPLYWNDKGFVEDIAWIHKVHNVGWAPTWSVNSIDTHDSYFLGLKLDVKGNILLGWIELEFNELNGELSVLSKGII